MERKIFFQIIENETAKPMQFTIEVYDKVYKASTYSNWKLLKFNMIGIHEIPHKIGLNENYLCLKCLTFQIKCNFELKKVFKILQY